MVVKLGLGLVPEGRQIFGSLSVMDNLLLGTYGQAGKVTGEIVHYQLDQIFSVFPILRERLMSNEDIRYHYLGAKAAAKQRFRPERHRLPCRVKKGCLGRVCSWNRINV